MKKSKLFLLLGTLIAMSSCSSNRHQWNDFTCPSDFVGYSSLADVQRKSTYKSFLSYMPATLNYTTTMQSENASHIANFVDGLVEHDRFGNLVPCLATTTGEHNEDYTEWTFKVKDGIKWVTAKGEVYKNEDGTDSLVKAEDFKSILKVVLNSATASESSYLPMLIIKGAEQYFTATSAYELNKNLSEQARNTAIFNTLRSANLLDGCTINDIPAILNFEKVGVEIDETTNSIKYILSQPADYFPTMLTYLPFLPLNYEYYNKVGAQRFGATTEILFCGAYILSERSEMKVVYEKNPYYWDISSVKTERIEYSKLSDNVPDDFARNEFLAGNIDGFTLNSRDEEGWKEYVLGEDGKGTIVDPHNSLTYSQEGQGDKSSFFFYINLNREAKNSTLSDVNEKQISNLNKALKYSYFRKALFNSLDLEVYNARNGIDETEQRQYQINTYTPKYFVTDNEGKDYFEYLLDAYEKKHNVGRSEAEKALNPGQVNQISMDQSVQDTTSAIEKLKVDDPSIEYPIVVEYSSLYGDATEKRYDNLFIEYSNERLNGCIVDTDYADPKSPLKVCKAEDIKVKIIPNTKIQSSTNYIKVSNDKTYSLFVAGWGPDYGDPMTYAHTMVKGGDMADSLGIGNRQFLSDESEELLATYGEMVSNANKIVSKTSEEKRQRYSAFADAEIFLLEELGLFRPLYQRGQGYSCSVSKFIPYRSPRSGYGLSGDKLKGMEILDRALYACERKILKDEWDKEKSQSI